MIGLLCICIFRVLGVKAACAVGDDKDADVWIERAFPVPACFLLLDTNSIIDIGTNINVDH